MMMNARSGIWMMAPLASLLVVGCAGELDPNLPNATHTAPAPGVAAEASPHIAQYMTPPGTRMSDAANATGLLSYYGGPVISSVKVVQVNWNANVDPTIKNNFGGFYSAVTNSELFDWLDSDYATTRNASVGSHSGQPGTNQHIGRGSFAGAFTLNQTLTNIKDADIQSAITSGIASGALPAADADTIYMVHFPPHTLISGAGGQSCPGTAAQLFCAYHSTFISNNLHIKYGVLPDTSVDCNVGCGNDASYFNNGTSVASHELVEAVTDADIGLVTGNSYDYPAAWAGNQGEIGDICNAQQGTIAATQPNNSHYVVQKEYDNVTGNCIVSKTVTVTNDFGLTLTPASGVVAAGGTLTFTIATTVKSGSAETITLSLSNLPAGVSGSFSPASLTAGGSATLTLAAAGNATSSTTTFTVTGTAHSATHSASVPLTVNGTAPPPGIVNGGFETGDLGGWKTPSGSASVGTPAHTGSFAAMVGANTPTNGDSAITQMFNAPTGTTTLGFWYQLTCPDTVRYDWATATLKDNTSSKTTTILAKTCTNNGNWVHVSAAITAGHSYTLTLTSHDDNYPGDATFTRYDDVTLQ